MPKEISAKSTDSLPRSSVSTGSYLVSFSALGDNSRITKQLQLSAACLVYICFQWVSSKARRAVPKCPPWWPIIGCFAGCFSSTGRTYNVTGTLNQLLYVLLFEWTGSTYRRLTRSMQNTQHGFVCRSVTAMTTLADIECRAVTSTGQRFINVTVHASMHACIIDAYTSAKYYVTDVSLCWAPALTTLCSPASSLLTSFLYMSTLAPGLSVDRLNAELCAPQQQYSANPPECRTSETC